MYAPPKKDEADGARVAEILLGPKSAIARNLQGYEARPQQLEVSAAVWRALKAGRHAVIQAGTGTGKSLAVAAPTIAYLDKASVAQGRPMTALLVTAQKTLQEQYALKDLKTLQLHLGVPFTYELMKGKDNYLCRKAWADHGGTITDSKVKAWVRDPRKGDLAKLGIDLDRKPKLRKALSACGKCPGAKDCSYGSDCYYYQNKARAAECTVIVTNYHMLLHNALCGYEVLPRFDVLILDEAHKLEDIARDCLTQSLSFTSVSTAITTLQALNTIEADKAFAAQKAARGWFSKFEAEMPRGTGRWELKSSLVKEMEAFAQPIFAASTELDEVDEYPGARECITLAWSMGFQRIMYAERKEEDGPLSLYSSPLKVDSWLKSAVYCDKTVIAMSATLASNPKDPFKRFKTAVGLDEDPIELVVDSPYSYAEQARYLVAKYDGVKKPPADTAQWVDLIEAKCAALIRLTSGKALVLCTSTAVMQELYYRIGPTLPKQWDVMLQGEMAKEEIIKRLRDGGNSVAFATKSFYEGVDVQGAGLSNVIIERIPFPHKGDPVTEAIRRTYGPGTEAFYRYDIPEAILHLLQAIGRLIRCLTDRGIIGLLDPRFSRAPYANRILRALPGWMGAALPSEEIAKIPGWLAGTGPAPQYKERSF